MHRRAAGGIQHLFIENRINLNELPTVEESYTQDRHTQIADR